MSPNIRRRRILAGIAGLVTASTVPTIRHASASQDLLERIAADAKRVSAGKTQTLRLLIPEGCYDNVQPIITTFMDKTGIKVETVETLVDDINTQLLLDSMSGESNYDLALPATFGLPDLVSSRAIIPLTQFAKRYEPTGYRDDILYKIGDSFDDELYGFQTDGDAYVMFYHQELLESSEEQARYADQFGYALAIPDTWQELDQQMAFFNRPDENLHGGLLFRSAGYLAWEWWVRFHAKGYWPLSESLVPQIDSSAGVEALEEMIRATDHLAPGVRKLGLFENWERYSRGDVYCNIGWGGTQKYLNSDKSDMKNRLKYGPTPGGIVDDELLLTPYFNWGWNYVVTVNTQTPELAYLFALFASTPEMSTASVREADGFFDPFRPEHYLDDGIKNAYSSEFLEVHEKSLKSAIPDLYLTGQSQYFTALSDGLQNALIGKTGPALALKRVADQWNLITERSGKDAQKSRWINLRNKYPENVRNRLKDIG